MRIGAMIDSDNRPLDAVVEQVKRRADAGFDHVWMSQIFGYDALSALAVIGARVPGIRLGTGVVPVYPRHPLVLAQQALTVQAATGNRLLLGVGLSHQVVVEGLWGYSFERPARYMKEYLSALLPMLAGETVDHRGEVITASTYAPIGIPSAVAPPVLVAALAPTMLSLAGRMAAGTITWMTGVRTVAEHVVPRITAAARDAGRPQPRVVVALPVVVTADRDATRAKIDAAFAIYPSLPSYRAMLDKEGAKTASDIAIMGTEEEVAAGLAHLAAAGATDVVALFVGEPDDQRMTQELLVRVRSESPA